MTLITETHPALTVLPWDHTEADTIGVHGIANVETTPEVAHGPVMHRYKCHCGHWTKPNTTRQGSLVELIHHAEQAAEATPLPA